MTTVDDELWALTWTRRHIDADAMAGAIVRALSGPPLESRSSLLVRDALRGLQSFWGAQRFAEWARAHAVQEAVRNMLAADLGETGFRSMEDRLMTPTRSEDVLAFFRDLGRELRQPVRIVVGGSVALILRTKLNRATEDIDVVDELPAEVRISHSLMRELAERHGLILAHFQSHYLPIGWELRTWSLGRFDVLDVAVVDAYDVLVGKLFSRRTKDFDDLRTLKPTLDFDTFRSRLASTTTSFRADPILLQSAERNWYVLTGEPLPPAIPA